MRVNVDLPAPMLPATATNRPLAWAEPWSAVTCRSRQALEREGHPVDDGVPVAVVGYEVDGARVDDLDWVGHRREVVVIGCADAGQVLGLDVALERPAAFGDALEKHWRLSPQVHGKIG